MKSGNILMTFYFLKSLKNIFYKELIRRKIIAKYLKTVVVSLHCQLNWVCNHLGDTLAGHPLVSFQIGLLNRKD